MKLSCMWYGDREKEKERQRKKKKIKRERDRESASESKKLGGTGGSRRRRITRPGGAPGIPDFQVRGQVSRGARSAADHFDLRPHQSSPNHTPLISARHESGGARSSLVTGKGAHVRFHLHLLAPPSPALLSPFPRISSSVTPTFSSEREDGCSRRLSKGGFSFLSLLPVLRLARRSFVRMNTRGSYRLLTFPFKPTDPRGRRSSFHRSSDDPISPYFHSVNLRHYSFWLHYGFLLHSFFEKRTERGESISIKSCDTI